MKTFLFILLLFMAPGPAQTQNVIAPGSALDRIRPARSVIRQEQLRLRMMDRTIQREGSPSADKKRKTPKAKRKARRSRN